MQDHSQEACISEPLEYKSEFSRRYGQPVNRGSRQLLRISMQLTAEVPARGPISHWPRITTTHESRDRSTSPWSSAGIIEAYEISMDLVRRKHRGCSLGPHCPRAAYELHTRWVRQRMQTYQIRHKMREWDAMRVAHRLDQRVPAITLAGEKVLLRVYKG
jgi:hypothetical protein